MSQDLWKQYATDNKDVKEEFCGACLAVPLAFAGVGASAYGASSRGKYKTGRKASLWIGIITIIISVIIAIYYLCKCETCR